MRRLLPLALLVSCASPAASSRSVAIASSGLLGVVVHTDRLE